MAGMQKAERMTSTKLMPAAPTGIHDSRSRLLFECRSRKKGGSAACPVRRGLEEQLKPQETARTVVRWPKQSRSQGCSPTQDLESEVMCASSPNISKVTSPQLPIRAVKEGLRRSQGPQGRRGMNSCVFTSTSTLLRSAASLNDLSLMHEHQAFSVPSPKHDFRKETPADSIGEDCDPLQSIPEFFLSPRQLPHAQMHQKGWDSVEQFPFPPFGLYPACSDLNLSTLASLFSGCCLSSSFNFLACPLYSEQVHSSQTFRSPSIPGGNFLQMSSMPFSRPPNFPMLPGQAPSQKRNLAAGHANSMAVSSSTPDVRVPGQPKSGPPPVGDIFQGPWLPKLPSVPPLGFMHFQAHVGILWGFHI